MDCSTGSCKHIGLKRWVGRTAVVSGASSGIGAAMAVALADVGMKVVGLARERGPIEELNKLVNGKGSITGRECDLAKPDDIASAFQWVSTHCGGTDLLVSNAGVIFQGHITDIASRQIEEQQIREALDVNFRAYVLCSRHAVRSMKQRNYDGHLVFTNSSFGHYIPYTDEYNVHAATKHAVTAYTTALMYELSFANSNIKITSLSPGVTATRMASLIDRPALHPTDIANALVYVIGTPPHVNES